MLRRESPVFAAPFYPVSHDKEPRGGPINKTVANREGYIPFAWPRRWPLTVRWSDQLGGQPCQIQPAASALIVFASFRPSDSLRLSDPAPPRLTIGSGIIARSSSGNAKNRGCFVFEKARVTHRVPADTRLEGAPRRRSASSLAEASSGTSPWTRALSAMSPGDCSQGLLSLEPSFLK
jgi:hypothetical protein